MRALGERTDELCERKVVEYYKKMNNGLGLIKRALALFLVLLLSIENFAAVVSDNDGSAFITKAEFDSLKNSFQSQIDQYNTSLDSKIDGAIASYLAGIRVSKKDNIKSLIESLSEDKRTFRNATWNNYNSGNVVAGDAGIQIVRMRGFFDMTSQTRDVLYGKYLRILLTGGNDFGTYNNYDSNPTYGWWTPISYDNNNGIIYVPTDYQYREKMHYRAASGFFGSQLINDEPSWDTTIDDTDSVFHPDNSSPDPVVKSYYNCIPDERVDYVSTLTATFELGSTMTNYCGNLRTQCFNQLGSGNYWFLDYDKNAIYTNTNQFNMACMCYRNNSMVYKRLRSDMIPQRIQNGGRSEYNINIITNSATKTAMPLTQIKNQVLTNLTGETVSLYSGLPMCYLPGKPGKMTFDLELSQDAIVCLNYGQFGNEVVTADATKYDKNFGSLAAGTHKLEFDMSDEKWNKKDGILWLKVNRTSSSVNSIRVNVTNIVFESE